MNRPGLVLSLCLLLWGLACSSSGPAPIGQTGDGATGEKLTFSEQVDDIAAKPHETVRSANGAAELLIPSDALPAGTNISQLKVTPHTPADMPVRFEGGVSTQGYRLEPDGLTFTKPVLFRINLDGQTDAGGPFLLHVSKDKTDLLNVATVFDAQQKKSTVSTVISHFSSVMAAIGNYHLALERSGSRGLGETFDAVSTASVEPRDFRWYSEYDKQMHRVELVNITVTGEWASLGPELAPGRVRKSPNRAPLTEDSLTTTQKFTCARSGPGSLRRTIDFTHDVYRTAGNGERYKQDPAQDGGARHGTVVDDMVCRGANDPIPTPTVTPVPQPDMTYMFRLDNGLYPSSQFRLADPDLCQGQHYHPAGRPTVYGLANATSLTIVTSTDPAPNGCGFGKLLDVRTIYVRLDTAQVQALTAAAIGGR